MAYIGPPLTLTILSCSAIMNFALKFSRSCYNEAGAVDAQDAREQQEEAYTGEMHSRYNGKFIVCLPNELKQCLV